MRIHSRYAAPQEEPIYQIANVGDEPHRDGAALPRRVARARDAVLVQQLHEGAAAAPVVEALATARGRASLP